MVVVATAALLGGLASAAAVGQIVPEATLDADRPRAAALPADVSIPQAAPSASSPRPVLSTRSSPPQWLRIPALELRMRVVTTGVADDGAMELPASPRVLGWYRFGAGPADPSGATVLAGHVDTAADGAGPLSSLGSLDRGDRIEVHDRDGRATYVVTSVTRIGKNDIDLDQIFARDGRPRLHLVTCGGRYLRESGGYEDNVVVAARRLGHR